MRTGKREDSLALMEMALTDGMTAQVKRKRRGDALGWLSHSGR